MEPDGDPPPIWAPPSTRFVPNRRRRRRLSSLLIPVALTIAAAALIFVILFFLPPSLSRNSQFPKTNTSVKNTSVKKSSWNGNSINVFLVLFAVLCGVCARRNDENPSSDGAETVPNVYEFDNRGRRSLSGANWLEFPDLKSSDRKTSDYMSTGSNRLRSSSSYPDLRHESVWRNDAEQKLRYFDDFGVDFHTPPGSFRRHVRQSHAAEKDVIVAETRVREIPVDRFELKNPVPPPPKPPVSQVPQPPPVPPPPPVKRRRPVRSVPKKYNLERGGSEAEFHEKRSQPTPPPPQLPELKFHPLAERREKTQRKKNGTTKEIATAIVSLYQSTQKKRKKKTKSRDIFEIAAQNQAVRASLSTPSVPPPPPPPPPSRKVLQNFFKKSSNSKRVHSVPTANTRPPPPPPPPPSSIFNTIFKTGTKSKRVQSNPASSQAPPPPPPPPPSSILNSLFKNGTTSRRLKYIEAQFPPQPLPPAPRIRPKHTPASAGKPPKPTKPLESVVIAPPSPLIPMPPPPPPFKVPEMKFIVKGDFVRIRSTNSSLCSSPGLEDFDVMSIQSDGGDSFGPPSNWPSPDVDMKADTFISRHRDEWRLERMKARFG